MEHPLPRFPLLRIMLGNATLLTFVYLSIALTVELVRRLFTPRWAERLALALESLPARTLELVGLFRPLRRAYAYGELSEFWVRMAFGATTIAIIFAMALLVGAGMWLLRRAFELKELRQGR
ncbi:MAG: hypothetical protein ACOZIN_15370 [Myxococcota bacterium]